MKLGGGGLDKKEVRRGMIEAAKRKPREWCCYEEKKALSNKHEG